MPRPPLVVVLLIGLAVLVPSFATADRSKRDPRAFVLGATHGDRIPRGSDRQLRRQLAKTRRARVRLGRAASAGNQLELGAWCGEARSTDDTQNQSHTGPRIKVLYAYPNDRPNRFATMDDLLQADARDMTDMLLGVARSTRTLRFDTGTPCGPGYLDVMSVPLPRTAAQYTGLDAGARMAQLKVDLASAAATVNGIENYLVYADATYSGDGVAGIATVYLDDKPGPANASNSGGLWAVVYGDAMHPAMQPDRLTTALHEVTHNLGAVQESAPNSTGAGHCVDEADVMCYADGGPNNAMTSPCPVQAYDCGNDDYFDPAPVKADYLKTHWNVYDSAFLCAAGSCVLGGATITNALPSPRIVMRDASGAAVTKIAPGAVLSLDGSESLDDQGVASYAWDVGDNGTVEGFTAKMPTSFPAQGRYSIRLTVTDKYGASASLVATIDVVTPPPPVEPPAADPLAEERRETTEALNASVAKLRSALRTGAAKGRIRLGFVASEEGYLETSVSVGARRVLRTKARVSAGSKAVSLVLSDAARRALARGGSATVTLRFVPDDGPTVTVTERVALQRTTRRSSKR